MRIPVYFESEREPSQGIPEEVPRETNAETPDAVSEKPSVDDNVFLRMRADFENLKKRCQRDIAQGTQQELAKFFTKFLSIYDDLERAITFCEDCSTTETNQKLSQGICLIHKRIADLLREHGVERIEPIGKPFDPLRHEAILVEHHPGLAPDTIIEEYQSGYLFRGSLLRPAKVKVSG